MIYQRRAHTKQGLLPKGGYLPLPVYLKHVGHSKQRKHTLQNLKHDNIVKCCCHLRYTYKVLDVKRNGHVTAITRDNDLILKFWNFENFVFFSHIFLISFVKDLFCINQTNSPPKLILSTQFGKQHLVTLAFNAVEIFA